jgi:hypothetical protein
VPSESIILEFPQPHPGQLSVIESGKRFTVLMCGRRWGKTTCGQEIVSRCALEGGTAAWIAPTYKLLSEAWRTVTGTLKPVIRTLNVQERRIELVTGGVVDFWSADTPDPGRGRDYDDAFVDEAGLIRNLNDVVFGAMMPTLAKRRGSLTAAGTPKGQGEFYRLYLLGKQGDADWAGVNGTTEDNPFIPKDEIETMRRMMPPEIFDQEVRGIPIKGSANPFGQANIDGCTGTLSDLPPVVFGIDLAQSSDWTVIIGLDTTGAVCHFDRFQNRPWPDTTAHIARTISDCPTVIDATGVGRPVVDDLQRRCPNVEGFIFTAPSKKELMGGLSLALQGREIRYPAGRIVEELESFEAVYSASGVSYSAPPGLHDDCVCALALAVRARGVIIDRPVYASFV